ncbi:hypothetical protein IB221_05570 [Pantoea sp. PNT01]|uniref:Uncharacterized protein n=1 Tax=Pantoea eucalypti TaxID=470933 RepID=A0ABY2ZKU1_9GAMM|nr:MULTISPECIES: hypothetical protein [Pantoea]AWP32486.1 hypothetical protein B9D02_07750 [Pantoea vagans]EFM18007.1 hypothetical protein PanABDRAFT_4057 [Pantoea sp. aB]MBD9551730.1 hypothetical protein [Pantoea sp. PNT01]MDJ0475328.1 hypothetical protein [Pantoea eucalypti]QGF26683.1 hypothetical protein EE896_07375 [Pantoea eucalypti]
MRIEEDIYLENYEIRRKRFIYDRQIYHSYVFVGGSETYTVIVGDRIDEQTFTRIGYRMPPGISFPVNGLAEVCFDVCDGLECMSDFRHISIPGLGSAVVLKSVVLALMAHHESFSIGGFVFQPASGEIVERNRPTPLEEIYDAMLGLKNELRYNRRTGLPKKAPQPLIPDCFQAYKVVTTGRACYVVL